MCAPPLTSSDRRDLRIDFFRGLALYIILIDHIGSNPIARFTYHRFGFSDGAEAFVFLSGLSCGIAYYAVMHRRGLKGLAKAIARRGTLIFAFYVLASVATILLVSGETHSFLPVSNLERPLARYANEPLASIWSAILLIEQPSFPGILILYIGLTFAAVPTYLLAVRYSALAAGFVLGISGCVWLIAQFYHFGAPFTILFPYFDIFAWQFLFLIGMYVGVRYRRNEGFPLTSHPSICTALVALAWVIVIVSFVSRFSPFIGRTLNVDLSFLVPYGLADPEFKYHLCGYRLIHFLSAAVLVTTYVKANNPILQWGHRIMIDTGRWSLQIFSLGAVLSVLVTTVFHAYDLNVFGKLTFVLVAVLLTSLATVLLTRYELRTKATDSVAVATRSR